MLQWTPTPTLTITQQTKLFCEINTFVKEEESDGQLAFLDVLLCREDDGTISTSVYRKATHTNQYLSFRSHHPTAHKVAVVRTLLSHRLTDSLSHCLTVLLSHCLTVTLLHCHTVSLSYYHTVSQSHCLTVFLSYCFTFLL